MDNQKNLLRKIREFQKICWDIERQSDEFKSDISNWERIYVTRKISIWITYLLRNSKITPNQITVLWVFLGAFGALLFAFDDYWMSLAALFCIYASFILDNVDGELARYKRQYSIEGSLIDMLGHQVIFPLVFGCLTFSEVLRGGSSIIIFLGLLATALVTPLTKMQENVWLLLCIKALAVTGKFEDLKETQAEKTASEKEKRSLLESMAAIIGLLFTQSAMFYLLVPAVVFDFKQAYLSFYGIGIPLVFIPKYFARARVLRRMAAAPRLLKRQFRPEWLDS